MSYGTGAFEDGYGDFKQPTVIDYDRKINSTYGGKSQALTEEEKEQIMNQFQIDQDNILSEILNTNPIYASGAYQHLIFAKDNKLTWDVNKINSLKSDVDWLYSLSRYVKKRKKLLITK